MSNITGVLVTGVSGRMGQMLVKLINTSDKLKLAGVTEESIQMEEKLFLNTKLSAPKGCDPDSFPPLGHHQQPS